MTAHTLSLGVPPPVALRAVNRAADEWGAAWTRQGSGGRLALPVTAGVRRGVISGQLDVEPSGQGSLLTFGAEESHYQLNRPAVFILLLGAVGALGATLWPLFPKLLAFAPLAVVLALCAWFLVASRVRTSTPDDFLELVRALTEMPEG